MFQLEPQSYVKSTQKKGLQEIAFWIKESKPKAEEVITGILAAGYKPRLTLHLDDLEIWVSKTSLFRDLTFISLHYKEGELIHFSAKV